MDTSAGPNPRSAPGYTPAYPYLQTYPSATDAVATLRRRALWATIALAVAAVLDVIGVVSGWFEISLLSRVAEGGEITEAEANASDTRQAFIGLLQLAMFLVTVVFFLLWVYQANKNLPALGVRREDLKYSPGWTVGWFFIPFANLVMPFLVVQEIWKASNPDANASNGAQWKSGSTSPLLWVWWIVWIVSNLIGWIAFRVSLEAETVEPLLASSWATLISDVGSAVAAVLAILVIRGITARQEEKARRLTGQEPAPQPMPSMSY